MSPQEQTDLDKMKAEVQKVKLQTWESMKMLRNASPELLHSSGHKSQQEALVSLFDSAERMCQKLVREFVKKYPDER